MSKAQQRRDALAKWHNRDPWPCVILAVDPGKKAGATLISSGPSFGMVAVACLSIDTISREIEGAVKLACDQAIREDHPLILAVEDWGAGGQRGIDQWIGLGEARGPWKREFLLCAEQCNSPHIRKKNIVKVNMTRWRSRVVPETGMKENGKFRRFTPDEWKEAAYRSACALFPDTDIPHLDAAESACIGAYAARSDEVGKVLSVRHLIKFGMSFSPLEQLIK